MTADEVRGRLAKVFARVFGRPVTLTDEMKPGDVEGWDSAAHVTLILATEREFKIKFKTSELANMASVGELVAHVLAKEPRTNEAGR